MRLLKKKIFRPLKHIYTEDDYKWVGKRKNYTVTIRRKTEISTLYWFIISDTSDKVDVVIYNSKDENLYYDSLETTEKGATTYIDTMLH